MLEWLLAPIDPARAHEIEGAIAWHGRSMALAWAFLAPIAVVVARFLKVLPWQDWPRKRDTQAWWRFHWMGQSLVLLITIFSTGLILGKVLGSGTLSWHGVLGYTLLSLLGLQIASGIFRGSKGGPTALNHDGETNGDHYDMTPWRRMFELFHKSTGYGLLALGATTVLFGLWQANAPNWMWVTIALWWMVLLSIAVALQKRGWAIDTYQAIWGPDSKHPGNRLPHPGWGMRRRSDVETGEPR